jgi:hypothetical protein
MLFLYLMYKTTNSGLPFSEAIADHERGNILSKQPGEKIKIPGLRGTRRPVPPLMPHICVG